MSSFYLLFISCCLFSASFSFGQRKQERIQSYFLEVDSILWISSHQSTSRSLSAAQQERLSFLMNKIMKKEPLSFRTELYRYLISRYDTRAFSHLLQAAVYEPEDKTILRELAIYYWITMDMDRLQLAFQQLRDHGILSDEYCLYGSDLLESVPLNGILLTHGFSDSFGCFYEQVTKGKRGDVFVISLDLLQSASYRDQLLKKGMRLPKLNSIDTQYVAEFVQLNSDREITSSLTIPAAYSKAIHQKKYITGLGVTMSSDPQFDNYFYNNYAWNEAFSKGVLEMSTEQSIQLAGNYLPMLLELRRVELQLQGDLTELDTVISSIAKKTGKLELVQLLLQD